MSSRDDRDEGKSLTSSQACQIYLSEWKSGQARPLEDTLQQVDPAERFQAFRSLLIMEFRRLIEADEKPKIRDYLRRFPDEMSIIAEVLEMFPSMSSKDIDENEPFEITGYGSEAQAAMDAIKAKGSAERQGAKSKSGDRIPQIPMSLDSQNPNRESHSKHKDESAYDKRPSDTQDLEDSPRSRSTQGTSSESHPTEEIVAHINPTDLANLVTSEGDKKGKQPVMKLVIDWGNPSAPPPTPDSNSNQELSPDSLYNKITSKSIAIKSPLAKPIEAPKTKLKRAKSSDPEQEVEEDKKDVHWKDNLVLLSVIGVVGLIAIMAAINVFVFSSAAPVELPKAAPPATAKKAAPKEGEPKAGEPKAGGAAPAAKKAGQ